MEYTIARKKNPYISQIELQSRGPKSILCRRENIFTRGLCDATIIAYYIRGRRRGLGVNASVSHDAFFSDLRTAFSLWGP